MIVRELIEQLQKTNPNYEAIIRVDFTTSKTIMVASTTPDSVIDDLKSKKVYIERCER